MAKRNRRDGLCARPARGADSAALRLSVTAETEDRVIMAIEHARLPITAVEFHPEPVMTLQDEVGMPVISAVLSAL